MAIKKPRIRKKLNAVKTYLKKVLAVLKTKRFMRKAGIQNKFNRFVLIGFAGAFAAIGIYSLFQGEALVSIPATPTIPVCGVRRPSDIQQYTGPSLGTSPISVREINGTSANLNIAGARLLPGSPDKWYIRDGTNFHIYNAGTNALITSFSIASASISDLREGGFAVDSNGDVYVVGTTSGLHKFDITGQKLWTSAASGPVDAVPYSYGSGAGLRIGAMVRGLNGSNTWDTAGARQADNKVIGTIVRQSRTTGNIISGNGKYIRIYSSDGLTQKFYMETDLDANDPGPFHFYAAGGAEELADGTIVVADGKGIYYFDSQGAYKGKIQHDTNIKPEGAVDNIVYGTDIQLYNDKLYFVTGTNFGRPQHLSSVTLAATQRVIDAPQEVPFNLGIGAGPFTKKPANFFPSGTTPEVFLQFYPWWSQVAAGYSGEYTIRTIQQVKANQAVAPVAFDLSAVNPAAITDIPVTLPSTAPGFYEVDVKLKKDGVVVSADCLTYSIGAPGETYNPATIANNTPNQYATDLTYEFGMKLLRANFYLDDYLSSDPNAPLTFPADKVADIKAASARAAELGITFEIQIAVGSNKEKATVTAGTWDDRITELVNFYKPYVRVWEIWNEPNNTYSGDGAVFTNNVLKPAYNAIKAADPSATVVGGGILGTEPSYYNQIAAAGGLNYMDVLGIHPYTGHNRSFEEQGQVAAIQAIKDILAANGKPNMPIYDTESGFWNSGTNQFYNQGDKIVRKVIHENSLGITHYANFYLSGDFTVEGQTWALQGKTGLTPGGKAMVTLKHKLGGRTFQKWLPTGIPHTYAAEYGPSGSSTDRIVVIWADDFEIAAVPLLNNGAAITVTDQYGAISTLSAHSKLTLSGSVQYLSVPAGQTLSITPAETYAANKALASAGASAAATSYAAVNPPSKTIDGITDTQNKGNNGDGISVWTQDYTDNAPELTITLPGPTTLNRLYISSQGLGSVQTGLRNYDVQVDDGSGTFTLLRQIRDEFYARNRLISFEPRTIKRIKLTNLAVNYSGYGNGLPPPFWPSDSASLNQNEFWMGQTTVYEVEAYAPGTVYVPPPDTDTASPTVSLTFPANGSTVSGTVNVTSNASDNIGVSKVDFYVGSTLLGTDTSSPYSYSWNTATVANGTYSLTARAYDAANNSATSAVVSVSVNNTVPPGPKPGDINNDGKVDVFDLSILASNWLRSGASRSQGDLDGNGLVNVFDLSILASNWGR